MKTNKNDFLVYTFLFACMMFTGCTSNMKAGNLGHLQTYPIHSTEPVWIRDGEPIEFEGEMWYPVDGVETLMDSEVYILGEYRGTQFFVDKIHTCTDFKFHFKLFFFN